MEKSTKNLSRNWRSLMSKEKEITFALPVKDDAKALLDYSKKVGSETDFLSFGAEGLRYSIAQEELFIESLYENENQYMLLAKDGDAIIAVGSIAGSLHPKFSHRGELGISVLKSYWGQGIATVMMEEMLDWVREYSTLSRVELEVVAINKKARHLYEKCGFVEEGLIKNGVKIGDGYEDIVLMAKMIER